MKDEEILKKIGAKLKELRLEKNVKQKELSEKSGLSMFSISQIETGHNTSVLSLIQVLKALDRVDMLDPFLKEHEVDTEALAKYIESQQPSRKRVTTPRQFFSEEEETDRPLLLAADDSEIEWTTKRKRN